MRQRDNIGANTIGSREAVERFNPLGAVFTIEHWRGDKLLSKEKGHNIVTNEGINYALDAALSGGTQISTWYIAIFSSDTTPASGDSYATPSFTEATAYTETTRPQWQEAGVSSKQVTNAANKASFTASTGITIYGAALVGGGTAATTKGDSAGGGTLYNSIAFSSSKTLDNGDVLKVGITINGSDV